jgi:hypothetical protein
MLNQLAAAIEDLDVIDIAALDDDDELGQLLVDVRTLETRLDARVTGWIGRWDARKAWGRRARSAASWLAFHARMPLVSARRRVALARASRSMPAVAAAWRDGDIESAHVSVLARAHTQRSAASFERDEPLLVEHASSLRFDDFGRVVSYWLQGADPDGAEREAREVRDARRAHLSHTFNGAWVGDLLLDAAAGAIVHATLTEIERELFEADQRAGTSRTPPQRRADAFVEMATRARTAPHDGRRPAPLFTVLVGYETFAGRVCELANGTALTPGELVPWLTAADIERVVFDGPSRVIDVGTTRAVVRGRDAPGRRGA